MKISFIYEDERFRSFDEKIIKDWIKKTCKSEKKQIGEISYNFVKELKILELNQIFLNHNFFTDIITFNYSLVNIINGDIYISFETVKTNSRKFKNTFDKELYRVIIHGIMHLCGYDDNTKNQKEVMRSKENHYLDDLEK